MAYGRRINLALEGSDDLALLEAFGANANVGGKEFTHIILREDARTIEVYEEFLHGTQHRCGTIERLGYGDAEIHVKLFMIRHKRLLKLTENDVAVLWKLIGDV